MGNCVVKAYDTVHSHLTGKDQIILPDDPDDYYVTSYPDYFVAQDNFDEHDKKHWLCDPDLDTDKLFLKNDDHSSYSLFD